MNDKGNNAAKRQIGLKREQLVHVDATLRILESDANPEAIPSKRALTNIHILRSGELSRLVMTAFREADGEELITRQIVDVVMREHGVGESARRAIGTRVRGR